MTDVEEPNRNEARFHDQQELYRNRLTPEEFLRKYANYTFYAIRLKAWQMHMVYSYR